jgi:hypothetical protein
MLLLHAMQCTHRSHDLPAQLVSKAVVRQRPITPLREGQRNARAADVTHDVSHVSRNGNSISRAAMRQRHVIQLEVMPELPMFKKRAGCANAQLRG